MLQFLHVDALKDTMTLEIFMAKVCVCECSECICVVTLVCVFAYLQLGVCTGNISI